MYRPSILSAKSTLMNTFSTIIVDDESSSRADIQLKMRADPEIRVVANCADGRSAVDRIKELRPDVAFLDVDLPNLDGFGVLEELEPPERPHVVFLAPNEQYAVRAFDVSAVDYLLKPFSDERFAAALARAKDAVRKQRAGYLSRQVEELLHYAREFESGNVVAPVRPTTSDADPLVLKAGGALHFIKSSDVIWIEAQGDFVKVQTALSLQLVRETLQQLEQKLDAAKFLRIHRSFIVNLDHVSRVESALYGDYSVHMSDGSKLRLSRNYRAKLQALVNGVGTRSGLGITR
jgi:two-component system LytT family response regulator